MLGSLHYLFVFFPRVLKNEDSVLELNHLNFDYLGVIVGFFTLLVTLLVGWNIYSTIKARDELGKAKDDLVGDLNTKLQKYEKCCSNGMNKIADIESLLDGYDKKVDKSNVDMRLYAKSLSDLSIASLRRQTLLILEVACKTTFSSNLYNESLYYIGNALEYANQSTIKDSINPICNELYVLTKNILDRKLSKHVEAIEIRNIDRIFDEIGKINKDDYYAVNDIIINLEEIRKFRQGENNDNQLISSSE